MKDNAVDQRRWKTVNVTLYKKNNGGSVRKVAFGMLIRKLIFLCLSFVWQLQDNGVVKNLQFCPLSLTVVLQMLIYRTWAVHKICN